MHIKTDFTLGRSLLVVLGLAIVSGCGISQADGKLLGGQQANMDKSIVNKESEKVSNKESGKTVTAAERGHEKVTAVGYDGAQISASVISTGCTRAEDFVVEHAETDGYCRVLIVRTKPDMCRRAPFVADIKIDWLRPASCSELPVVVDNPILVLPDDGFVTKRLKK